MGVVKTVNSGLKCFADDGVVDTYGVLCCIKFGNNSGDGLKFSLKLLDEGYWFISCDDTVDAFFIGVIGVDWLKLLLDFVVVVVVEDLDGDDCNC